MKFAHPDRVAIAFTGDGAMQMNGLNELVTVEKYWKQWSDPRLVFVVLNNRDLNQVTWEMRIEEGNPKLPATQTLPDFPYARYADLIGLMGIRVDRPEQVQLSNTNDRTDCFLLLAGLGKIEERNGELTTTPLFGNTAFQAVLLLALKKRVPQMEVFHRFSLIRWNVVGFISQSGALCTAVLDWSLDENVGFSAFVSIGSMVDVGWGDLIDYLGGDSQTTSIVLYMETVGDARSFLSAAREVALTKPIIILKAGRTQAATQAAASHTSTLTSSYDVFDAACHRSGVLPVNRIDEMFSMAEVLAKQPLPRGPRLTILTNAGGPGVLATDALMSDGGALTKLGSHTLAALNQILPGHWSHSNPVDILGDADPDRYAQALEIAAQDPNSDGLPVILTPQAMTDPTLTAEQVKRYATSTDKPILASWMGGAEVACGTTILNRANIPTFPYPDTAAQVFDYMWHYRSNLHSLYETPLPSLEFDEDEGDQALAAKLIDVARQSGRTLLTEFESKQLLATYGIPTVETRVATNEAEAVKHAEEIGYPVVLKLYSETVTHKTDVGGVHLNLAGKVQRRGGLLEGIKIPLRRPLPAMRLMCGHHEGTGAYLWSGTPCWL